MPIDLDAAGVLANLPAVCLLTEPHTGRHLVPQAGNLLQGFPQTRVTQREERVPAVVLNLGCFMQNLSTMRRHGILHWSFIFYFSVLLWYYVYKYIPADIFCCLLQTSHSVTEFQLAASQSSHQGMASVAW